MFFLQPRRHSRARTDGFTLIELMVVVVILGILSSITAPAFNKYVLRAKRSEAMLALRSIYELQRSYHAAYFEYADSFGELGFEFGGVGEQPDGSVRGEVYTYTLQTWDLNGQPNANFRATATADLDPSDPLLDVIIIENQLTVKPG